MDDLKLTTVLDDLPVGLILINNKGLVEAVNSAFLQKFVKDKSAIQGIGFDKFLSTDQKSGFNHFLAGVIKSDGGSVKKFDLLDSQSKIHKLELYYYPANKEREGVFLGVLLESPNELKLLKEIEKQQQLKESVQDKLEEEGELSEMKSRFLSIASHEFRTPLAGILSSLNLMSRYLNANEYGKDGVANKEKALRHIDKISESVKNLTTILNKFLALGNIERGEIPVKYASFDIKKTLESQVSLFQQICKPGQKIKYFHKGKGTKVFLDMYLLKNILNNLLSNAIKFSDENTTIQLTSIVSPDAIQLIVADSGIGIPRAEQKYIFRRFYRAKNALSFQEGTGLGLNIVKKYVELMQGIVSFESKEDVGTTFRITFSNVIKPK
jgi:hypothetical protein